MNQTLRDNLITIAGKYIDSTDVSHDMSHVIRVLANADYIREREGGDADIITAAALLHDVVVYAKNDERGKTEHKESAEKVREILTELDAFPNNKIEAVTTAIAEHSWSGERTPSTHESRVVYDADKLELTGAVALMRTFASTQHMNITFYDPDDPFCRRHTPNEKKHGIDFLYSRPLKAPDTMYTDTARTIARERTARVKQFINNLADELNIS